MTIVPPKATSPAPAGLFDRMLQRALFRRLERLAGAHLAILHPDGVAEFGERGADVRATIVVRDARFFRGAVLGGSIGAAEAWQDCLWDSDDLVAVFRAFLRNLDLLDALEGGFARAATAAAALAHRLRRNSPSGAKANIRAHYDLGNEFFRLFLDPTLCYSSAVFERPGATLEEASTAKMERLCQKLRLAPGDRLLEIGTGWGGFAIHAASRFGCRVTTATISREQFELARARVAAAGLADRVDVLFQDYRHLTGRFDKIASIEMIEAVGHDFLPLFFGKCRELLADDGVLALQAITMADHRYERYRRSVDFIQHSIFPGSLCPSLSALAAAAARASDFRLVHLEEFGPHYARTLALWRERFTSNAGAVRALGFPERFVRLWLYYLAYCEAGFLERTIGVAQLVYQRAGCRAEPLLAPLPPLAVPAG